MVLVYFCFSFYRRSRAGDSGRTLGWWPFGRGQQAGSESVAPDRSRLLAGAETERPWIGPWQTVTEETDLKCYQKFCFCCIISAATTMARFVVNVSNRFYLLTSFFQKTGWVFSLWRRRHDVIGILQWSYISYDWDKKAQRVWIIGTHRTHTYSSWDKVALYSDTFALQLVVSSWTTWIDSVGGRLHFLMMRYLLWLVLIKSAEGKKCLVCIHDREKRGDTAYAWKHFQRCTERLCMEWIQVILLHIMVWYTFRTSNYLAVKECLQGIWSVLILRPGASLRQYWKIQTAELVYQPVQTICLQTD